MTTGSEPGPELRHLGGPPEVNGEGGKDPTQRKKEKQNKKQRNANEATNVLKRSYKGYTPASSTQATSAPSLTITRYVAPTMTVGGTGPGKVTNDGECGYRESQMVAT